LKISVSLSYNLFEPLTYEAPEPAAGLQPGARVLVPLGKRIALAWVLELDSPYRGRLKRIIGAIDDPFRPQAELLDVALRAGAAYFASAGSLLDHCLPPSQKSPRGLLLELGGSTRRMSEFAPSELERLAAGGPLRFFFRKAGEAAAGAASGGPDAPPPRLLLGSGREAEYREACRQVLAGGRSVVLVVPDNATARYWQAALPEVDPYHSEVTAAARERTWRQYCLGKTGVVCGGIQALLLPQPALGLIVIDRASSPLYLHGAGASVRPDHLAEIRAAVGRIPLLRGSLSHSCATYASREDAVTEDRRRERGVTCRVHALKGRERGVPAEIVELVRQNHAAGSKTLVLVNRIRPAVHLFCEACRRIATCPRCGGPLKAGEGAGARGVSCRRCSFRREATGECPRCGGPLAPLHDISIESLSRAVERVCGEEAVLALTAAELKDPAAAVAAVARRPVVIATLAALSPFFQRTFALAVWVKPESFFNLGEFAAGEMIRASGIEAMSALADGGELHVFSVFHFHYSLQYLMDEGRFFERELKYRRWFMLPPYAGLFELELRDSGLRALAAAMRELYGRHRDDLGIRRAYLASRQPRRGSYRGILELHASAERIAAAGLHRLRRSSLRRTGG
jgi:primosomal protein N'